MGTKSSKQEKTTKTDTLWKNENYAKAPAPGGTGEVETTAVMSFDMENIITETPTSKVSKVMILETPEADEVSSEFSEDSESRVTSGIDSEVSHDDTDDENDEILDTESESAFKDDTGKDEESVATDLDSNNTADEESTAQSFIDSRDDTDSWRELANHLNPNMINDGVEDIIESEDNIEGLKEPGNSTSSSLLTEDRERISCGADVTGCLDLIQQYESDECFPENSVESSDDSVDEESDEEDHTESIHQEFSFDPYPIQSESRQDGIILIQVIGPRADRTQDFWKMILEKRIPTIHMTCDYVEEGVLQCTPYVPVHGESEIKCGIYIIRRLGTERQLSMNLKRQQVLIYEKTGKCIEYKHSVTHFHEISSKNIDSSQSFRNSEVIRKHVSHQPNPQLLVHGSW